MHKFRITPPKRRLAVNKSQFTTNRSNKINNIKNYLYIFDITKTQWIFKLLNNNNQPITFL